MRPDVEGDRIGVYGVSVGGVSGLTLAADDPGVRCVVSVSAFSSWKGIAGEKVPLLGSMLVSDGLDATTSGGSLGRHPLLLVHGVRPNIVPPSHASLIEAAARQAGVPTRLLLIPGLGHNDILIDDRGAQDAVAAFFHESLCGDCRRIAP